jgi:hypothetical protein
MEWALGFADVGVSHELELLGESGQSTLGNIDELSTVGVPSSKGQALKRVPFEGEFSTWSAVGADAYLSAFGIKIPDGQLNRHAVFAMKTRTRMTIQVPALVLMRAFFKPTQRVLPAMFSPANIDLLSFVDYSSNPPCVVVDDAQCAKSFSNLTRGVSQANFIHWLQTSLSARRLAQSVHQYAHSGHLCMDLPIGRARIIFHGRYLGNTLFATKASLMSVEIPSKDSIAGVSSSFTFHSNSDSAAKRLASIGSFRVPMHLNGQSAVTHDEWRAIEPLLVGKGRLATVHSRRDVLDIILHKLSSGLPWKTVPKIAAVTALNCTMAFRQWVASGRFDTVLAYLQESRAEGSLIVE